MQPIPGRWATNTGSDIAFEETMKEVKFDINGKEYTVQINEFGAYEAVLTVNGKKYQIGLKDLGLESVSDIKPQPTLAAAVPAEQPGRMFFSETQLTAPAAPSGPVYKKPDTVVHAKSIVAPLPGLIMSVLVKPGDNVEPGKDVMIMEAMKMENEIQAHAQGVIKEIRVKEGDNVSEGDVLIVLE